MTTVNKDAMKKESLNYSDSKIRDLMNKYGFEGNSLPVFEDMKSLLEEYNMGILEKIDEFENKHIVMAQNIVEDEDWSKFKKQIISQDNSPKEDELGETASIQSSPVKTVFKSSEDTLCSNCGKPNSEHLKEKGKLYCWSTDGNTEGEFIPIGDEGVKG